MVTYEWKAFSPGSTKSVQILAEGQLFDDKPLICLRPLVGSIPNNLLLCQKIPWADRQYLLKVCKIFLVSRLSVTSDA